MELGVMINGFADSVSANRGIASILDNPIYTALVMTFVVMVIFFFSSMQNGGVGSVGRLRTAFYIFFSLLMVIFVYHRRFQKCQSQQQQVSVIQGALASFRDLGAQTIPSEDKVPIIQPVYLGMDTRPTSSFKSPM